jgi:hypothetical protein
MSISMINHVRKAAAIVVSVSVVVFSMRCSGPDGPSQTDTLGAKSRANAIVEPVSPVPPSASAAVESPPVPPAVPRMTSERVEVIRLPQVYVDQPMMVVHRKVCRVRTPAMLRLPLSVARSQGYQFHSACEFAKDPPEYREKNVVHPQWVVYEAALADYNTRHLLKNPATVEPAAETQSVSYASSSPPAASSGQVQVRGHYRKDGTYVRPHTRSKPRK